MTDLRTLLHDAAPDPSGPVDVAEIHRRAEQRGVRRIVAWVASMGVLLASLPVGNSLLLQSADDGEQAGPPATEESQGDDASTPEGDQAPPSSQPPSDASAPSTSAAPDDGDPQTASGTTPDGGGWTIVVDYATPTPSTTSPPPVTGSATHPAESSCQVDTTDMAAGQQRVCRFTATDAGGAAMTGNTVDGWESDVVGEVTVTRDGNVVYVWNSDEHGAAVFAGNGGVRRDTCGDPVVHQDEGYFIQAGDLVDVVLTVHQDDDELVTLGAGQGWSCLERQTDP